MESKKRNSRAQTSLEFLILTAFMFLVFFGALAVGAYHISNVQQESELAFIVNTAEYLASEIAIAVDADDGYRRTVELPSEVGSAEYDISFAESENFTEVTMQFVNHSFDFEYVVITSSNVSGYVETDPLIPLVTISIINSGGAVRVNST